MLGRLGEGVLLEEFAELEGAYGNWECHGAIAVRQGALSQLHMKLQGWQSLRIWAAGSPLIREA